MVDNDTCAIFSQKNRYGLDKLIQVKAHTLSSSQQTSDVFCRMFFIHTQAFISFMCFETRKRQEWFFFCHLSSTDWHSCYISEKSKETKRIYFSNKLLWFPRRSHGQQTNIILEVGPDLCQGFLFMAAPARPSSAGPTNSWYRQS